MSIAVRFAISMTLALALVMAGAGFFLFNKTREVAEQSVDQAFAGAAQAMYEAGELDNPTDYREQSSKMVEQLEGNVIKARVVLKAGSHAQGRGLRLSARRGLGDGR